MRHGAQAVGPVREANKLIWVLRSSRRKDKPFGQMAPPVLIRVTDQGY